MKIPPSAGDMGRCTERGPLERRKTRHRWARRHRSCPHTGRVPLGGRGRLGRDLMREMMASLVQP
jgi:hypothetical protein